MNMILFINDMFDLANAMLDIAFLWGGLIALSVYPIIFFLSNLRKYTKDHHGPELLTQTVLLYLFIGVIALIWASPDIIFMWKTWFGAKAATQAVANPTTWADMAWIFSSLRWGLILVGIFVAAYAMGHEHGKNRWFISAIGHIAVIAIGWFFFYWMGIFFITIPAIAAYYGALYSLANIILPASDPEDRVEKRKKFFVLGSYAWGAQSPITVVDGHAWKKHEPRIPGDITWEPAEFPIPFLNKLQRPGLIWTRAHQVSTISGGTKFKRVDGPGVAFTGKLERLDQVFDLRLQLRTREIEVVSKDGIRFNVRYFTAFRIDKENWSKELYDKIRPLNPLLRGADKLTHTKGSFPFSHARVQAALGTTSTKAGDPSQLIFWDQWAMNVIEDQARKVISQKNLDEMWRPADDFKFANAMDVIANETKANAEIVLRAAGILLVVARVVNFSFPYSDGQADEFAKQQLASWGSEWARKRNDILAEAEAEAERAQQEARAYAESVLLNSFAEGLQKTHEINPELPRHVIAMRYLSALQDYIHKKPADAEENEETLKRMADLQEVLTLWHQRYHPEDGR
ncbi:MAG: hypothetical protein HY867_06950 [Chloroflexi bacterium]|nr:hypothetical protein [Chloroflexota bacterium]